MNFFLEMMGFGTRIS